MTLVMILFGIWFGCAEEEKATSATNECELTYDAIGSDEIINGFAWVDWIDNFALDAIQGEAGIVWQNGPADGCVQWQFTPDDSVPITYAIGSNPSNPTSLCPEYSFMKGTLSLESFQNMEGDGLLQEQWMVQIRKSYVDGDNPNIFIVKEVSGIAGDASLNSQAISGTWELQWFAENLSGTISSNFSDGSASILAEIDGACPEN